MTEAGSKLMLMLDVDEATISGIDDEASAVTGTTVWDFF
jgi:hypothetical protein